MTPKRVIGSRCLERAQRLSILLEQLVQQAAPRRVREGSEHIVHGTN